MSQCTVLSLREIQQIKRDAKRDKSRLGVPHHKILDKRAQQLGYSHWADLNKKVIPFQQGCVLAYLQCTLDADDLKVLQTVGFEKSDFLYTYASADLLSRENQFSAKLRADGLIKPEDEEQDERSRFRRENPLYGVQLFALPSNLCTEHTAETILADIKQVCRELNEEHYNPICYLPLSNPDYIWLDGTRTDLGIGHSPHLPPELEYTEQELDDFEYATALEATAGWG